MIHSRVIDKRAAEDHIDRAWELVTGGTVGSIFTGIPPLDAGKSVNQAAIDRLKMALEILEPGTTSISSRHQEEFSGRRGHGAVKSGNPYKESDGTQRSLDS